MMTSYLIHYWSLVLCCLYVQCVFSAFLHTPAFTGACQPIIGSSPSRSVTIESTNTRPTLRLPHLPRLAHVHTFTPTTQSTRDRAPATRNPQSATRNPNLLPPCPLPCPLPSLALSRPMLLCVQRLRPSHLNLSATHSSFIPTSALFIPSAIRPQVRDMSVKPSLHLAEDFLSFVNASPTRMFVASFSCTYCAL